MAAVGKTSRVSARGSASTCFQVRYAKFRASGIRVFKVVDVGICNEHADRLAVVDHLIESLRGRKAHNRDRTRNHLARPILHELNVKQNLVSKPFPQQSKLLPTIPSRKPAL